MASIYSLTTGEEQEMRRVFAQAGFTKEDLQRLIREPYRAIYMLTALRGASSEMPDGTIHTIYTPQEKSDSLNRPIHYLNQHQEK